MLRSSHLCILLLTSGIAAHAANDWPERVVTIEEMKALAPMTFLVPRLRAKGEVKGPAVMRVHVDTEGVVRRVALLESCGSPAHDEAALHAMRSMRFAPKAVDGVPADVTLVVPLHLPVPKASSGS